MQSAGCARSAEDKGRARTVLEEAEAAGSSSAEKSSVVELSGSRMEAQLLGEEAPRAEDDSSEVSSERRRALLRYTHLDALLIFFDILINSLVASRETTRPRVPPPRPLLRTLFLRPATSSARKKPSFRRAFRLRTASSTRSTSSPTTNEGRQLPVEHVKWSAVPEGLRPCSKMRAGS
jgi:hypothetical protein